MPFRLITRREIQSPAPGRQNCNFEFQKAPAILALSLEPALRLWQAPTAVAIDCILLQSTICFPEASGTFGNSCRLSTGFGIYALETFSKTFFFPWQGYQRRIFHKPKDTLTPHCSLNSAGLLTELVHEDQVIRPAVPCRRIVERLLPARIWPKKAVSAHSQKRNSIAGPGPSKMKI